jgi:hypothetical protein
MCHSNAALILLAFALKYLGTSLAPEGMTSSTDRNRFAVVRGRWSHTSSGAAREVPRVRDSWTRRRWHASGRGRTRLAAKRYTAAFLGELRRHRGTRLATESRQRRQGRLGNHIGHNTYVREINSSTAERAGQPPTPVLASSATSSSSDLHTAQRVARTPSTGKTRSPASRDRTGKDAQAELQAAIRPLLSFIFICYLWLLASL